MLQVEGLTLQVAESEPEPLAEALAHASQDADAEAKNVVSRLVNVPHHSQGNMHRPACLGATDWLQSY